jgi:hypothetical protein
MDPEATGNYEEAITIANNAELHEKDTDVGTRTIANVGDVSPRSACLSVRTGDDTNRSLD